MTAVLGVDPSLTCTGLARIVDGRPEVLRVPTEADGTGLADVRRRIRFIVGQVVRFAPAECLVVIEDLYIPKGDKAAGSVKERAWLWGLLVDQLVPRGPVVAVANTTRSAYALKGGAKKPDVLAAMRGRFPGLVISDDNCADALALAAMGARWRGAPIDGVLTRSQLSAFTGVRWPMGEGARA